MLGRSFLFLMCFLVIRAKPDGKDQSSGGTHPTFDGNGLSPAQVVGYAGKHGASKDEGPVSDTNFSEKSSNMTPHEVWYPPKKWAHPNVSASKGATRKQKKPDSRPTQSSARSWEWIFTAQGSDTSLTRKPVSESRLPMVQSLHQVENSASHGPWDLRENILKVPASNRVGKRRHTSQPVLSRNSLRVPLGEGDTEKLKRNKVAGYRRLKRQANSMIGSDIVPDILSDTALPDHPSDTTSRNSSKLRNILNITPDTALEIESDTTSHNLSPLRNFSDITLDTPLDTTTHTSSDVKSDSPSYTISFNSSQLRNASDITLDTVLDTTTEIASEIESGIMYRNSSQLGNISGATPDTASDITTETAVGIESDDAYGNSSLVRNVSDILDTALDITSDIKSDINHTASDIKSDTALDIKSDSPSDTALDIKSDNPSDMVSNNSSQLRDVSDTTPETASDIMTDTPSETASENATDTTSEKSSETSTDADSVPKLSFAIDRQVASDTTTMRPLNVDVHVNVHFDSGGKVYVSDSPDLGKAARKGGQSNFNRSMERPEFIEGGDEDSNEAGEDSIEFYGHRRADDEEEDYDDEDMQINKNKRKQLEIEEEKEKEDWKPQHGPWKKVPTKNRHALPSHESITGGQQISIDQMPFLAILKVFKQHGPTYCTATIISDKWVISAAHCIGTTTDPRRVEVIAGQSNVRHADRDSASQRKKATRLIVHPDFPKMHNPGNGDLALIEVDPPFTLDNIYVSSIKLRGDPWFDDFRKANCNAAGWGRQRFQERNMGPLQLVSVVATHGDESCPCVSERKKDKVLCLEKTPGYGICKGDSGGPLICDGELVGVAHVLYPTPAMCVRAFAGEPECGVEGWIDIYMYVCPYLDWIKYYVGERIPDPPETCQSRMLEGEINLSVGISVFAHLRTSALLIPLVLTLRALCTLPC